MRCTTKGLFFIFISSHVKNTLHLSFSPKIPYLGHKIIFRAFSVDLEKSNFFDLENFDLSKLTENALKMILRSKWGIFGEKQRYSVFLK